MIKINKNQKTWSILRSSKKDHLASSEHLDLNKQPIQTFAVQI